MKLKPCPFCGNENIKLGFTHALAVAAVCNKCTASGATIEVPDAWDDETKSWVDDILDKAAIAWNQRV